MRRETRAPGAATGGAWLSRAVAAAAAALLVMPAWLVAAVGCSLNDPDRDIKRIYPQSTGYKTSFVTLKEKIGGGPQALERAVKDIEARLGDKLDPVYESVDVPYAFYAVLEGDETIGVVHGVNQKGTYGGMQLILATDLQGRITDFYYQKISSPEASKFRGKAFTQQFRGLTLDDFLIHDGQITREGARDRVAAIGDPSAKSHDDFLKTLRGIKKNLILLELLSPVGAGRGQSGREAESRKEGGG
jgi:hypothetical protein